MWQFWLLAFYIVFPAVVLFLAYRYEAVNKLGPVIVCYIVGITLGNIGVLPAEALEFQQHAASATVALALPLLLYSLNIRKWSRLAGKTMLSMLFAIISIAIVSFLGYIVLRHFVPDAWKIAGMSIGVYTGGTPNLASIMTALDVDSDTFIVIHTYDTLFSLIYVIFMMTIAQKLFGKFLPPFEKSSKNGGTEQAAEESIESIEAYKGLVTPKFWPGLLLAFGTSVLITAIAWAVGKVVPAEFSQSASILTITTLGILGSFWSRLNRIKYTFQLGMYLILIFSLIVGSMANIHNLVVLHIPLLIFIFVSIFGTMLLQAFFCWLGKVDTDTFIITSVSAIMSPPFVPVIASSLKNEEIILSGLTTGIIGYALGNYLGVGLAYLFHAIGG